MPTLTALAGDLLQRLAWTSLQACVLIAAVALLLRLAPRMPAAARSALWWLVGAQLLLGLSWSRPVELPLLSPEPAPVSVADIAAPMVPNAAAPLADLAAPALPAQAPSPTAADRTATADRLASTGPLLAVLAWFAGLVLQVPRLWRQWRRARAVHAHAEPVADPLLRERCRRQARALGLRRCPQLRQCATVTSPQVAGWLRPVVLLPARQALDAREWELALAHELAHLARRDLWFGLVPALAQRLFFFHPAVRWAMREYALHREAACDARVMRDHHAAVQAYGRLLLRLGVSHPLHAGLAGASPTFDNLKRRLLMLQQSVNESSPRARGWLLVTLVALAGVLPYRVTAGDTPAATVPPATSPAPAIAPQPMPAPAAAPAPVAAASVSHWPAPPPPPPAPLPPAAPLSPPPPPLANFDGLSARHVYIDNGNPGGDGFALLDDDAVIVTAAQSDMPAIERLYRNAGKPMLWFRRDSRTYVVRDEATIERARQAFQPVSELAREQGKLAGRQGKLAGKQAGLAAREAGLAREQAELARQQAELVRHSGSDTTAMREARRQALEQEQAKLEAKRAALEQVQASRQRELEAQQAEFEKQQRALDQRQQQVARQAGQQMQQLLEEAVRSGKAQPLGKG
ncbi:M56 family metallopeptidase [Fulvimonas yonginensis]|uniref:M56 family metallopeptidase n=1 Tax=Fulvimonas yonginensis TaxID=1495200 RepID=A0ABU8JCA9_9GAMM